MILGFVENRIFMGFCGLLRTFCLWFGAFGDQHTAMFTIRRKKLHVFLSLGAGRWDHA